MRWLRERGSVRLLRDLHFALMVGWIVMIPVSLLTGLAGAIWFVTVISLLALAETEGGAWQASRSEVATVTADTANVDAENVTVNGSG
jgi:hypothetical protein